ncbi:GNAT family N-acetyltransferase [Paenibacillus soyae]|uniref:GNAT family N-acetyltransferase n=1 Tax=Paenibacillus soyae TaxID=2969249 RepID=A0A9X2MQN6_9BACL|nr:GNAT family N-acetyltransferase [Paenibacillus soyae]MCR2804625.1 GNAT family N-acetyltransferase [Paenibacillus soyae]
MNNGLQIRIGSAHDLDILAELNKQLIEDEQHDNKMNFDQLKERMRSFISTDYSSYIFEENGEAVGYALVNHSRQPLYVRQFFICRNCRRRGYGKQAFHQLLGLLNAKSLDIEVMTWNHRGLAFWKSLGFQERSVYMRFEDTNE